MQLGLLFVVLLVAVLAVALAGSLYVLRTSAEEQTEQRALAIARSVAADSRFAVWVTTTRPTADGPTQDAAEAVRVRTGALYVVVTDDRGVRFSHPTPGNVGQVVSTDPSAPLAGQEVVAIEVGTLGRSARGKVPLTDASGAVVGSVSVGVPIAEVDALQRRLSLLLLALGAAALALGLLALSVLWRRVRRATLGLEPEEMANLLREHAAVLGGALEGIVAVDASGLVRVCNDAARSYLGTEVLLGVAAADSGLPAEIVDRLPPAPRTPPRGRLEPPPEPDAGTLVVAHGRVLDVRRMPVERDGRSLGSVVVLRDRTDLDDLGRELEATRALTDALRAQTHEHANRLHALSGMLAFGDVAEARGYLSELAEAAQWSGNVEDPFLAGLLAGKAAAASEQGVELRVTDSTWVGSRLARPLDTVTVVGNLIDNAIRAAASGSRRPAWVEVSLLSDGADLVAHVVDSGEGVAPGTEAMVFADGWTTKPDAAGAHGVGLALARVTARRHGGEVSLAAATGDGHGAAFTARVAGVLNQGKGHGTGRSPGRGAEQEA